LKRFALAALETSRVAIALSLVTFVSTLLGGLFALHLRDRLHLVLGFSAGALTGVAFLDLMPESLDLANSLGGQVVLGITAVGFFGYMLLDRTVAQLGAKRPQSDKQLLRSNIGAASLVAHSFLDGFAIGLGFQVSTAVGAIVAAAVIAHDFSDGINTVSVILRFGGDRRAAFRWVLADAAAPIAGVVIALMLTISQDLLGLALALFAGFFIYIGASELLPESYHDHPTAATTAMTILGLLAVYAAVRLASI
jgi:zinc transporter ZupT